MNPAVKELIAQANTLSRFTTLATLASADDTNLLQRAYNVLADFRHEWPGRDTIDGQSLLVSLRVRVALGMDRENQDIQDSAQADFVRKVIAERKERERVSKEKVDGLIKAAESLVTQCQESRRYIVLSEDEGFDAYNATAEAIQQARAALFNLQA